MARALLSGVLVSDAKWPDKKPLESYYIASGLPSFSPFIMFLLGMIRVFTYGRIVERETNPSESCSCGSLIFQARSCIMWLPFYLPLHSLWESDAFVIIERGERCGESFFYSCDQHEFRRRMDFRFWTLDALRGSSCSSFYICWIYLSPPQSHSGFSSLSKTIPRKVKK